MTGRDKQFLQCTAPAGSALILAVVLTSLLAIVGVLFVMTAHVDKLSASAVSETRDLDLAVETVVAEISCELMRDVPFYRDDQNQQEYYDYPDASNGWLASLEPYDVDPNPDVNDYRWFQISDITGFLRYRSFATQYVKVDPPGTRKVINEYPEIELDPDGELAAGDSKDGMLGNELRGQLADADGDGIADSKWMELYDITSSKGKPIYAAIRVIDNGGMVNVNTGYVFDPTALDIDRINGSSQMQINLAAVARPGDDIGEIHTARCGSNTPTWDDFRNNMILRTDSPKNGYLPFGISEELGIRHRYCISSRAPTRLENIWNNTLGKDFKSLKDEPYAGGTFGRLEEWQRRVTDPYAPAGDRRHLLTTYNMDRIINPRGLDLNYGKMVNLNRDNVVMLHYAIREGLIDAGVPDPHGLAAQMAVNIKDFRDGPDYDVLDTGNYDPNNDITTLTVDRIPYYGFERPCVYISELAYAFAQDPNTGALHRAYAIELYKPYPDDPDPSGWQLVISDPPLTQPITWSGTSQFHLMRAEDSVASFGGITWDLGDPNDTNHADPNAQSFVGWKEGEQVFRTDSIIQLQRPVGGNYVVVDSVIVPGWLVDSRDPNISGSARSRQRDITLHKCIRRLWSDVASDPNLGGGNTYENGDLFYIQAHPENKPFVNIGQIGMVLQKTAYQQGPAETWIGPADDEASARVNLALPLYQKLFNYLTVFDPTMDGIDNDADGFINENDPNHTPEWKIPGRININTAPWFVIAQLPWMSYEIAQAIVGYRDNVALGYRSIGELMQVPEMYYFATVAAEDESGFPDLTGADDAPDDFEERDLIFARISNLVTVRSDVFTAYILVRVGDSGPQKRVIAILDRSDVYPDGNGGAIGRVKVRALHPVPDPR